VTEAAAAAPATEEAALPYLMAKTAGNMLMCATHIILVRGCGGHSN